MQPTLLEPSSLSIYTIRPVSKHRMDEYLGLSGSEEKT